jgi:hypothetical protein
VTAESHSTHVRHLVAVPQPDEPAGSPIVTEEELREASAAAIDKMLTEFDLVVNSDTYDVLVSAWLDGALWGTIRARQHIEAMA